MISHQGQGESHKDLDPEGRASTPVDWGIEGSYLLPKLALWSLGAEAGVVVGTQYLMHMAVFTQGTYQTKNKWPRESASSRGNIHE